MNNRIAFLGFLLEKKIFDLLDFLPCLYREYILIEITSS